MTDVDLNRLLSKARAPETVNGRAVRWSYDPGQSERTAARKAAELRLAGRVFRFLELHHPGHLFRVSADHDQQLVKIELPPLLESPYSYNIPITVLSSDPTWNCVREAGGHILERFQLPRSRWDADHYRSAVKAQPFGANRRKGYQVPV